MSHKKIASLDSNALLEEYAYHIEQYFHFRDDAVVTVRESQSQERVVREVRDEVRSRMPAILPELKQLLEDSRPGVRLYAARDLIDHLPSEALKVYEELATRQDLIGFSAQSRLDRLNGIDPLSGPPPLTP